MIPTSIRAGRLEDLPELQRLHASSLRCYYYDDLADSGEPDLLKGVNAVLVDRHSDRLEGFVTFDSLRRSKALPASAPTRVPLRAAAFSVGGAASRQQFRSLFEHAHRQLPPQPYGYLFCALTEQGWLRASLQESGFDRLDAVLFYERKSHSVGTVCQTAALRPAQLSDLHKLAEIDAAAFEPLWHMGVTELQHLHRDCRFEIAELAGSTVGYSALRLMSDGSPRGFGSAQVVRLAVHPAVQGRGIGRQLLVACLCYASQLGINRVFLNTQESNLLSKKLYESLNFKRRGRPVPVLVKIVSGSHARH
ncbi:MAG: GNAT family N-acetyltransferase [Caldilineaceae bacterium SB0668_bin_21]|nr:GNAT family N-acetyltransferase [Caldilineaceae bacterium SB0668_bin_21]MYC21741.1 GNAT family N-acetyltransferase [Caldilineaceae bacterium SB0662_bin_25]